MNVLVVNCGSSSLKYQLIDMDNEHVMAKGQFEKIGAEDAIFTHKRPDAEKLERVEPILDHKKALTILLDILVDPEFGVISSMDEIDAVGHRVVHGAEKFADSVLITPAVMDALEECAKIAPLHNPPNIQGIEACQSIMPKVPQVAVFDTAFHQTMPPEAFLYGLPYEAYTELGVRRYGFHGTSHKYVSQRVAELMGKHMSDLRIISCHLGNGSSVTAIKGGRSIDTSMGFTPLSGLIMGTRCGDIDPAIVPFLMDKWDMTYHEIDAIMNKKSGVLGISGVSNDFRVIEEAAQEGNKRAQLALDMFHYKVRATIGAYAAVMGGVDAIVFTAGIGENGIGNRDAICNGLEYLGTRLDRDRNNIRGEEAEISAEGSKVKIFVVPTNEEIMIARDTKRITASLVMKNW
ncbi:acetate/propionate family kinase [Veillonella magna]|uniref:Acetate kinase n=1 Tax=Veillonella magna TaxID=464322 RepID=A0ABS2GFZ3_9FIRM|nr:acetate kinase [Veillonella magna]MBD8975940.1 acetate kinase [Veillonella magna]MBM6823663.1 acetate kinase [Veillonella magna]MBM6912193.1 acetate kinase [Veillonella magna]